MTRIDVRNELRNLRRLCRAGKGKESVLYKKYIKLFNEALDDWEKLIMTKYYIEDRSYEAVATQFNSSKSTINRVVSDSINKIKNNL